VPNIPCPRCGSFDNPENAPRGLDVAGGKAPSVGGSNIVRAMDYAARAAMDDHGLTDLHSARVGEPMAPKLPPAQQARADSMFSGGSQANKAVPQLIRQMTAAAMGQGANLGGFAAFKDPKAIDPIAAVQAPRVRPPVNILNPGGGRIKI